MKFGTLHWHPRNPQPVQPKPNLGQFKIIKEYTLDEPTTSGESSTPENGETEHVETATSQELSPPDTELVKPKLSPVPVEILTDKDAVKVETSPVVNPEIKASPNDYPHMKDLKIVVPKLNETDIDVWSDKVHSYYTYFLHVETEFKPVIVSVRGYSLRSAKHQIGGTDESGDSVNNDEPKPKKAKNS